jgi:hypothetical protein
MTSDPWLRTLERLPRAQPDAARAERVRARCHAALARQHVRPRQQPRTMRAWEPAVVVGLCVLYLAQVVAQAMHLYGLR